MYSCFVISILLFNSYYLFCSFSDGEFDFLLLLFVNLKFKHVYPRIGHLNK
jgi:hypothetical protein